AMMPPALMISVLAEKYCRSATSESTFRLASYAGRLVWITLRLLRFHHGMSDVHTIRSGTRGFSSRAQPSVERMSSRSTADCQLLPAAHCLLPTDIDPSINLLFQQVQRHGS